MTLPKVRLDVPWPDFLEAISRDHCELIRWSLLAEGDPPLPDVEAILSYSHAPVGGAELDALRGAGR